MAIPEVTPGGKALKYFSSLRLDIRRSEFIREENDIIGIKSNVKVVKSKVSAPYKVASLDIIYGSGISKINEILDLSVSLDLIKKSGSWYSYQNKQIAQGKDKTRDFLIQNKDIANKLEKDIKKNFNLN
ncbi:hypothetical protein PIE28_00980 [Candidatus Phytoplasma oryzae]|nr:hypothetical protein PIE28_00980 [Candidatus Phytoplasma oryzae]